MVMSNESRHVIAFGKKKLSHTPKTSIREIEQQIR